MKPSGYLRTASNRGSQGGSGRLAADHEHGGGPWPGGDELPAAAGLPQPACKKSVVTSEHLQDTKPRSGPERCRCPSDRGFWHPPVSCFCRAAGIYSVFALKRVAL